VYSTATVASEEHRATSSGADTGSPRAIEQARGNDIKAAYRRFREAQEFAAKCAQQAVQQAEHKRKLDALRLDSRVGAKCARRE
jgi:hypothetical protein